MILHVYVGVLTLLGATCRSGATGRADTSTVSTVATPLVAGLLRGFGSEAPRPARAEQKTFGRMIEFLFSNSFLLLVAMPGAPSSVRAPFVAMPCAPSSVLVRTASGFSGSRAPGMEWERLSRRNRPPRSDDEPS